MRGPYDHKGAGDVLRKLADDDEGGSKDVSPDIIIHYFNQNPNPSDSDWHAFAEKHGWNVHTAEAEAYKLATTAAKFLAGGKANEKGITAKDVDPEQLRMGIKVEHEHTPDVSMATRIALDHLAEIPDYYTRLAKMEAEAKGESKNAGVLLERLAR